jgi:hypothetical protein
VANLYAEFQAVVRALREAGVPFALCGGLAMAVHGHPRATLDIDLLVPAERVADLVRALRPLGFARREAQPTRLAGGAVVMHRLGKIAPGDPDVLVLDVIEVGAGATAEAWAAREATRWERDALEVVSRQGLIRLKRLRDSLQDRADIAALEGAP